MDIILELLKDNPWIALLAVPWLLGVISGRDTKKSERARRDRRSAEESPQPSLPQPSLPQPSDKDAGAQRGGAQASGEDAGDLGRRIRELLEGSLGDRSAGREARELDHPSRGSLDAKHPDKPQSKPQSKPPTLSKSRPTVARSHEIASEEQASEDQIASEARFKDFKEFDSGSFDTSFSDATMLSQDGQAGLPLGGALTTEQSPGDALSPLGKPLSGSDLGPQDLGQSARGVSRASLVMGIGPRQAFAAMLALGPPRAFASYEEDQRRGCG